MFSRCDHPKHQNACLNLYVCPSANSIILHGWNRCSSGLQECVYCCQLHQGSHEKCPVYYHLTAVCCTFFLTCNLSLLITLLPPRNDMFELSHRLIGIYKTSNQTRSEWRGIWLFNWTVELKRHISAGISIDNHSLHSTIPAPPPSTAAVWYNRFRPPSCLLLFPCIT